VGMAQRLPYLLAYTIESSSKTGVCLRYIEFFLSKFSLRKIALVEIIFFHWLLQSLSDLGLP
jgi:hypothetical protein